MFWFLKHPSNQRVFFTYSILFKSVFLLVSYTQFTNLTCYPTSFMGEYYTRSCSPNRFLTEYRVQKQNTADSMIHIKSSPKVDSYTFVPLTSKQRAEKAFARGRVLSKKLRKHFYACAYKSRCIPRRFACLVAVQSAHGMLQEAGEELSLQIKAWLCLGERVWRMIVSAVKQIGKIFDKASFDAFQERLKGLTFSRTPRWSF